MEDFCSTGKSDVLGAPTMTSETDLKAVDLLQPVKRQPLEPNKGSTGVCFNNALDVNSGK